MKKHLSLILAFTLIISLFAGCAAKNPAAETSAPTATQTETATVETESSSAAAAETISFTDLDGKSYTFDKPFTKALLNWTGAGGAFITMSALFGDELADHIGAMDTGRADMWEQYCKDLPSLKNVTIVGDMRKDDFDMEAALTCGADVCILPIGMKSAVSESIQPKLEEAGIPVIYIDYHSETIENHTLSTQIIGKLFGKEAEAQKLVDFYVERITALYDRTAKILADHDGKRPTVYVEVAGNGPDAYGNTQDNSYMWGAIIYAVGGTSIADGIVNGAAKMEPEKILAANPDKIILAGSYWPNVPDSIRVGFGVDAETTRKLVEGYLARDGWQELNAVKNGEVYVIHHGVAREIFDVCSVEAIAQDIWPEELADLDPYGTMNEFFTTFTPFTCDGTWFMKY